MKVLLYGSLRDAIGRDAAVDAAQGCSVADLRQRLASDHPAAAMTLQRSRAFIADRLVADSHVPGATDVIEFLPPVSGG